MSDTLMASMRPQRFSRAGSVSRNAKSFTTAWGTAKLPIPDTFLGRYVNVEAVIAPSDSELEISSLSVGNIPIPAWIIKPVTIYTLDWFMGAGKGAPVYASVRSVAASIARVRYREGVGDFLSLLDAERTQLQAEDSVAEAESGVFTSIVAVYKALGGISNGGIDEPKKTASR